MRKAALAAFVLAVPASAQATWNQLYPAVAPSPRADAAIACFEPTGEVVMVGGAAPPVYFQETWRLQGGTWSQVSGPQPTPRLRGGMVYDSLRQRLVLFGGTDGLGSLLDDVWEYDGTAWSHPQPPVRPPGRVDHQLAFDRARGVTVLFGGRGAGLLQDTWEWNGTSWSQVAPSTAPQARELGVMAFDPSSGRVMLHGGLANGTTPVSDTWLWDGTAWQLQFPNTPPTFRIGASAVCDLHRRRVVLHGGSLADPLAWEWDGSQWSVQWIVSPSARQGEMLAYDTGLRRTVLFGGTLSSGGVSWVVGDTWSYATPLPASVTAFGTGCPGAAGTPSFAPAPYELPWLGDTIHHRVTNVPAATAWAIVVTGFAAVPPVSLAPIDMAGCSLLVPLDMLELVPAAAGVAEWTYAVPFTTSFAGTGFFQQAFPLDPAANPFGLSASNALHAVFGIR